MWSYKTSIGTLWIVQAQDGIFYFKFGEDDTAWTGHADPWAVADDVHSHATSCPQWDNSDIIGPLDLSEWEKH